MGSRFKYKLESLKKLRELKLNMAKAELAMVTSNIVTCDQNIADSRQNVRQLLDDQRQTNDMAYVKLFSQLSASEQDKINIEMKQREVLQAELDRHSAYVSFLRAEVKAVEHHEGEQREEFNKEADKKSAKRIDEINSIMWNRKPKD